ncbi:MAG: hypothetical protein AAB757_00160 [Patescibacteria group bacterium]
MSDNKKFYLKIFFSSLFALSFLATLIFNPFGKNEEKNEDIESSPIIQSQTLGDIFQGDPNWTEIFSGIKEEREFAKNEIIGQIEKEKLSEKEKNVLKEKTFSFFSAINSSPAVVSPQTPKPIREKAAFKIFPAQYLNYVSSLVGYMEKGGFISKGDIGSLDKVDDVINVFDKTLNYFLNQNLVSNNEYVRLRDGLTNVWPSLLENEFKTVSFNGCPSQNKFVFFGKIADFLGGFIEKTRAQSPICFRPGPPVPAVGVNLWAPCCYCYCGAPPAPCGCLNAVCQAPAAAIFDPVTGICGCG